MAPPPEPLFISRITTLSEFPEVMKRMKKATIMMIVKTQRHSFFRSL